MNKHDYSEYLRSDFASLRWHGRVRVILSTSEEDRVWLPSDSEDKAWLPIGKFNETAKDVVQSLKPNELLGISFAEDICVNDKGEVVANGSNNAIAYKLICNNEDKFTDSDYFAIKSPYSIVVDLQRNLLNRIRSTLWNKILCWLSGKSPNVIVKSPISNFYIGDKYKHKPAEEVILYWSPEALHADCTKIIVLLGNGQWNSEMNTYYDDINQLNDKLDHKIKKFIFKAGSWLILHIIRNILLPIPELPISDMDKIVCQSRTATLPQRKE